MKHKKILIIGPPASGKSTFAKKYSEEFTVKCLHQDQYFFDENAQPVKHNDAINAMRKDLSKDETWLIEGNYNQVIHEFANEANLVIFLDLNRFSSLFRVIKRRVFFPKFEKGFGVGESHKLPWHFIKFILFIYPKVSKQQEKLLLSLTGENITKISSFKSFIKYQKILLEK